jgi:hypothetical protein
MFLLCEDVEHFRLALAYMKRVGINTDRVVNEHVASRMQRGGNDAWVVREFARQLAACRTRATRAKTLLVVLIDADNRTVGDRGNQLNAQLNDGEKLSAGDPLVLLIPRRHVETWICALLGQSVSEEDDCKSWSRPTKEQIRTAAETAYQWARPNATPGPTCVDSLREALSEWRRIG